MASARFVEMQDEMEKFGAEFTALRDEFFKTGESDILLELDEKLLRFKDEAIGLPDPEERFEATNFSTVMRNAISSLEFSAF